jgi:WD40 repeat protein
MRSNCLSSPRSRLCRSLRFIVAFAAERSPTTPLRDSRVVARMPTDAAPRCVAYDDTRTACVVGTAAGEIVFRERASSASALDAAAVEDHSKPSASPWTRQASARAADDTSAIVDIALSDAAHGRVIAAATASGEVSFWRASASGDSNGTPRVERVGLVRVEGGAKARCVAFAPSHDALTLAAACDDGVVRFYEPREKLTATAWESTLEFEGKKPGGDATALAWRRSSERTSAVNVPILAVGTTWTSEARHGVSVLAYDEKFRRWNVVTEMEDGLTTSARHLAWSATTTARGALNLVVASGSKCLVYEFTGVVVRGVEDAKQIGRLDHPCEVNSAEWNASGSVIATAAADGVVRLWSANLKDGTWREQTMGQTMQ